MTRSSRLRRVSEQVRAKVFPDHWSFLLGEVAMAAFAVLFATGVVLAFFYDASSGRTVYDGAYEPLHGVEMSRAYESVLRLSFDVPAGLVLRQVHHWAALVFIAAVVLHALRIVLTGAYRRPRRLNYAIGVSLALLALANGFFGASLPDDLLSGAGAQIGYSIALSIPVAGPGIADLLVGGEFPSAEMVHRFWLLHVFVVPVAIVALLSIHMLLVWRQTHTQFPGDGSSEQVVGSKLVPHHTLKTAAVFATVAAVLVAMGGLLQINPVWIHGPFEPAAATVPAGPDWYLMFVEGGLRILPPLHIGLGPFELPSPLIAGVVLPGLLLGALYLWPVVDEHLTGDRSVHHLLERPRDRPARTGVTVGVFVLLAVLTMGANHDYLGGLLGIDVGAMTQAFRVMLVTLPPIAGFVAWKVARDLGADDPSRSPPRSPRPATSAEPSSSGRARRRRTRLGGAALAVCATLAVSAALAATAALARRRNRSAERFAEDAR